MALSRTEVAHVARLARLHLGDDELSRLERDLTEILGAFETLQALDTGDDEPFRPLDTDLAPLRDDTARAYRERDALLDTAPDRHGRLFHVPKIIE